MQAFAPYRQSDSVPAPLVSSNDAPVSEGLARKQSDRLAERSVHFTGIPPSTILLTLNQLAVMTQNGVELAEALGHAKQQCHDQRLCQSIERIHNAVGEGSTFSAAVALHGTYFPPKLPAMLAAAEATGDIPGTLGRFCDRLRGELEMRGAIIGAMIYPVILVLASTIVMTALMLGVLPQFGRVFDSMGRPVPAMTQFLIDTGEFGRANWMYLAPSILLGLIGCFLFRRQRWVKASVGQLVLYAPFIKDASRPLMAGRNFRSIASMVGGGVPLLQAVQLTRRTVTDPSWNRLLSSVETNLIDGASASSAMAKVDFLPSEATQMMAAAERTGRVAEVLEDIGRFYEEDGARRIKRLIVALEPAIILVMGVVVACVVMSVMLPLLDVSTIQR